MATWEDHHIYIGSITHLLGFWPWMDLFNLFEL